MVPGNDEQDAETRHGFLPASTKVFKTGGSDLSAPNWKVGDLLPRAREHRPRAWPAGTSCSPMDASRQGRPRPGPGSAAWIASTSRPSTCSTSPQVSAAFDIQSRAGRGPRASTAAGHRGACYLVGPQADRGGRSLRHRRRALAVARTRRRGGFNLNWDHHDLIYAKGSCGTVRDKAGGEGRYGIGHWVMMGSTDRAFAALIDDMDQRGLLAETLVCFITEFGRTPTAEQVPGPRSLDQRLLDRLRRGRRSRRAGHRPQRRGGRPRRRRAAHAGRLRRDDL